MDVNAPRGLLRAFAELKDPRMGRTRKHSLTDILAIAICAVVCGADGWVRVEEFGQCKEGRFRTFLNLPNGIPSHDTFGRVFALLDPVAFEQCFMKWIADLATASAGRPIVIDGKVAIHMIHARSQANHMVLGQLATASLTFSTSAQGDGLTSIHQIIGGGILGSLNASGANLVGGIDMTGVIKTIKLHNIQSDIVMTGTWNKSTGVTVAASIIKNSTIQAESILSLKAGTLRNSSIETGALGALVVSVLADSNIQATTVKSLQASSSYQNTTVTASTITSAMLYNVETDNDGVAFGLQASTIKTLRLYQDRVVLTWKKNFANGISDFFVTLA